ncbi:MAG TPA: site-specific DNA-methyltransferase [Pyrinomonadaceae bacterium]|nr:site-specific DNA-methyltransferase [Pyrinomonadaceae bacterium]
MSESSDRFQQYLHNQADYRPLFLCGDSIGVLQELPPDSIDFCMTSPPYWGQRQYSSGGIGLEERYTDYITHLLGVFKEIHRTLKPTGSFWLNLGDTYDSKSLVGIPWRVAIAMTDQQGWVLRNSVVWNKVKGGPDNSLDRLRNIHENLFHFVKSAKGYYYDVDAIRKKSRESKVVNGAVVSATGVSGIRYKRQIELSTALSEDEKQAAFGALEAILTKVGRGEISDFRMVIRGQQRATHSDQEKVSGRAKELQQKGYYFLKYHPNGTKPSDVWDIIPEDSQKRNGHYAAYPEDLCKIPLLATCPSGGIALDPFCGTGTTNLVAMRLGRRSVGIDISSEYISLAEQRCHRLL